MTLALICLGFGMVLMLAGVKGASVRELLVGNYTPGTATNQSVTGATT